MPPSLLRTTIVTLGLCLAAAFSASAQIQLISTSASSWTLTTNGYGSGSVQGTGTGQYWNISVTQQPPGPSSVTLGANSSTSVTAGDACVATFWYYRADGLNGEANIAASFSQSGHSSLYAQLRGRTVKRSYSIPFIATVTGTAVFNLQIGGAIQNIIIGGLQVTDYGAKGVLSSSPSTLDCLSQMHLQTESGAAGTSGTAAVSGTNSVSGAPFFTSADVITTSTSTENSLNGIQLALTGTLPNAVSANDTLVAIFWAARDPGTQNPNDMGALGFDFGPAGSGSAGPVSYQDMQVDGNWKQFWIPFASPASYAANGSQFRIWCGANVQKLDVAGVQIIDLGSSVPAANLTNNKLDWPGRELSAAWRSTALTNIQKYRTGKLSVLVVDGSNNALSNVTVTASMTRQGFGFGTWWNWGYFIGNPPFQNLTPNYEQALSQYPISGATVPTIVNKVTDGDYKWPVWASGTVGLNTLNEWFRQHGTTDIRGHNLIWPNYVMSGTSFVDVPNWVPPLVGTVLSGTVMNHIATEISDPTVMSRITDWDIVNEPWDSYYIQYAIINNVAPQYGHISRISPSQSASCIAPWYNQAYTYEPESNLYINDDGIEENMARYTPLLNNTNFEEGYDYSLLQLLTGTASHVDGIGFESHEGGVVPSPVTEKQIFDRFAGLTTWSGAPLAEQVTEYECQSLDPTIQADFLADYMTVAFSEPNMTSFMLYGFWGGDFAVPTGSSQKLLTTGTNVYGNVFDSGWNRTQSGDEWMGLIYNQWWTGGANVVSNTSGVATITGYLGRYALTATHGGITKTYYVDLTGTEGASVTLQLSGSTGTHVWTYEPANAAAIYPPSCVASSSTALNGFYVTSSTNLVAPPVAPTQNFRIDTEVTGTANVWVHVFTPNASGNQFNTQVDFGSWDFVGGTWSALTLPPSSAWTWCAWPSQVALTPTNAGHTINFDASSIGDGMDEVLVTDDPTFQPNNAIPNGTYILSCVASGDLLSIDGSSPNMNGDICHQWANGHSTEQQWKVQSIGNGIYTLACVYSGDLLSISGTAPTSNGDQITQWQNVQPNTEQQWRITPVSGGAYLVSCVASGDLLSISGTAPLSNGDNCTQWQNVQPNTEQQWFIIPQ